MNPRTTAAAAVAVGAILLALIAVFFATRGSHEPVSPATPREVADAGPADPTSAPRLKRMRAEAALAESEATRVEIEQQPEELLELEILDPDAQPASGARIVLVEASGEWRSARADEHGRASFEPREGTAELLATLEARHPYRETIALAAGNLRIQIPRAESVSGRVLLDGGAPDPAIEMTLYSDRTSFADLDLSPEVRDLLGLDDGNRFQGRCTTDRFGEFAFDGLDPDWSGALLLPSGYPLASGIRTGYGERRIRLERPTTGLVLDVERLPRLRGRIVQAASRTPVAGAQLGFRMTWSDGRGTYLIAPRSRSDGRFELILRETDFASMRLDVESHDGRARLERTRQELGDDLDLGDIELEPGAALAFRVRDTSGAPIAGAVARVKNSPLKATTDDQGLGELDGLTGEAAALRVDALGFWSTEILLPRPLPADLEIILRAANRLTITVTTPSGDPVPGILVEIGAGTQPLFPGHGWRPSPLLADRQKTTKRMADGSLSAIFGLDARGRHILEGVVTGTPLSLTVLDPLQVALDQRMIAPLSVDEQRVVELVVADRGRTLSGVVRDEQGRALALAVVVLRAGMREEARCSTGDDGRFRFQSLHAAGFRITAEKEGYAKAVRDGYDPARDGAELELVLVRGHRVVVEVVDALGNAVEGGFLYAAQPGEPGYWTAKSIGAGKLLLDDVPPRLLTLTLELAGRRYELEHDARIGTARFELPVHGKLQLSWRLAPHPAKFTAYAVVRSSDPAITPLQAPLLGDGEGLRTFPSVLPGTYEVAITRSERADEPRKVLASAAVTIVAGQTTTVELAP
jgi:hypothetical protein